MPSFIQASFAKGELAPALYGRVDTAAYQVGLRTARNVIVRAYGGISNRPGLTFIGPVKDHTHTPRLIEFQFKTTDTYQLEFGDEYLRVIRNDGHVLEAAKTITGISQASPAVVTSASHGFSNGDEVFVDAVAGMTRVNQRRFIVANAATDTFELTDQVTGADIDSTGYAAYVSGGTVARVYTIAAPYSVADLMVVKFTQSADVMTLTHPSYAPVELRRTAHTSWAFTVPTFAPSIAAPTGETVVANTSGSETRRYRVTASAEETLEESLTALSNETLTISGVTQASPAKVTITGHTLVLGDEIEINGIVGMTELNGRRFTVSNINTDDFTLDGEDSTGYTTYGSGGTANKTFVEVGSANATADDTIAWAASANAQKYSVYLESNGIYGWLGDTETLTFNNKNMAPDLTVSPPTARNPFLKSGDYPGTVSYYEQRRVFGGSTNRPDTSFYSQVASTNNMSVSDPGQDDDAITATLTSRQVNEIRHYMPGNDLIVFTSGGEWRVNSGNDSSFSAKTIQQKPQTAWGCSHNQPIIVGNTILFVTENASSVRSLGYSLQIDGYTGSDVNLLAGHLFETYPIVDWTFARSPDPIAYITRGDGQVCTMTFNQEQEMIAWTHWDTQGKFERVSSLRHGPTEIDEAAYFVVKRTVNGHTVRYIERTHSRRFVDVRDCFFVDAGISYDSPVTITGVSLANPCVVTAPAHGFSNGDEVDIFDITWVSSFDATGNETQPDQLNTRRYTVANKTTDTFELTGADSSAFAAYVEGGTVRKAVTTISGLDHLEGCPVAVLADGNVVSGLTVASGAITLARKASRVHVGLRFISDVETLNIEAPSGGTIQAAMKKISRATVRFEKSRGLFIGPTSSSLLEMKQREFENMSDPTALLTGDKNVILDQSWNTNGRIFLRQQYPLPMTILAVIPDLNVGT